MKDMTEEKILLPVEVKPEVDKAIEKVQGMTLEKQKGFLMFMYMWMYFNTPAPDKPDKTVGAA